MVYRPTRIRRLSGTKNETRKTLACPLQMYRKQIRNSPQKNWLTAVHVEKSMWKRALEMVHSWLFIHTHFALSNSQTGTQTINTNTHKPSIQTHTNHQYKHTQTINTNTHKPSIQTHTNHQYKRTQTINTNAHKPSIQTHTNHQYKRTQTINTNTHKPSIQTHTNHQYKHTQTINTNAHKPSIQTHTNHQYKHTQTINTNTHKPCYKQMECAVTAVK